VTLGGTGRRGPLRRWQVPASQTGGPPLKLTALLATLLFPEGALFSVSFPGGGGFQRPDYPERDRSQPGLGGLPLINILRFFIPYPRFPLSRRP
jgi:hypothetical protein